jgi:hypothetical protein
VVPGEYGLDVGEGGRDMDHDVRSARFARLGDVVAAPAHAARLIV